MLHLLRSKTGIALAFVAAVALVAALSSSPRHGKPQLSFAHLKNTGLSSSSQLRAPRCPAVQRLPGASASASLAAPSSLARRLSAPMGKCVTINSKASLCNNGVLVLRPSMAVRATTDEGKSPQGSSSVDTDKLIEDLTTKWENVDNKGQVAVYAGGALVALIAANAVVTTIDSLPFLPYFTEVVGTCYSVWFAYKYLLFEDSRKELSKDVDTLIEKISGAAKSTRNVE